VGLARKLLKTSPVGYAAAKAVERKNDPEQQAAKEANEQTSREVEAEAQAAKDQEREAKEANEQTSREVEAEAQAAKDEKREAKEARRDERREQRAAANAEKLQAREAERAAKRERDAERGPVIDSYQYDAGLRTRTIKLYRDGTIESGSERGSVVAATARVDQTGGVASRGRHNRWVQDMRQTFLTIEGPGVAISVKISNDKRPVEKARKFAATINSVAQQLASADGEHPALDAATIPDQIKKLAELRETGILSDDEFETKKRELLERM
jgi:Short C-terminal domain